MARNPYEGVSNHVICFENLLGDIHNISDPEGNQSRQSNFVEITHLPFVNRQDCTSPKAVWGTTRNSTGKGVGVGLCQSHNRT